MKNFNIKVDSPKPSSEEIQATKDFGQLHQTWQQLPKPWYQNWMYWGMGGMAVVALVIAASVWTSTDVGTAVSEDQAPAAVAPLVEDEANTIDHKSLVFPYDSYSINGAEGGQIRHTTGTVLHIPPRAFSTLDGKEVSGMVTLKYREAHHPVDLFLANVPLDQDRSESAGMMQIYAEQDGERLTMVSGQFVFVEMATFDNRDSFNLFQLDRSTNNWSYLAPSYPRLRDGLEPKDLIGTEASDEVKAVQLDTVVESQLVKPMLAQEDKQYFKFGNLEAYPELAEFTNVRWEVNTEKSEFDASYYEITWEVEELKRLPATGEYLLKLMKNNNELVVIVNPVFSKEDYPKALAQYEQELAKTRGKTWDDQSAEADSATPLIRHQASTVTNGLRVASGAAAFVRIFDIGELGAYQIIKTAPKQNAVKTITAGLKNSNALRLFDATGTAIDCNQFYGAIPGTNSLYLFRTADELKNMKVDEVWIWGLTDSGELAIAYPQTQTSESANKGLSFKIHPLEEGLEILRTALVGAGGRA